MAPLPPGDGPTPALADARAGEALAPAWEIGPPPGFVLSYDGLVDAAGNVYWRETYSGYPPGATNLVSATRDGVVRFRVPGPQGTLALAGPAIVSAALEPGGCTDTGIPVVEGYSTADGARLWRRPLLEVAIPWLRSAPTPGGCRYGGLSGLAAGSRVLVAVSVLDREATEHQSGYVALDPSSGEVVWAARTSPPDNVMMAGAPLFAEDGNGYGSRTDDYQRDDLLLFPLAEAPRAWVAPAEPWHGAVLAAHGPLLVSEATGGSSWTPPPSGIEVRCRSDGSVLAPAGSVTGLPLLSGDALWFFGDNLSRHAAATGALLWRVRLGSPPSVPNPGPFQRPGIHRAGPVVSRDGSIVFTEQQYVSGPAPGDLTLMTPLLRAIDGNGREVLRRTLPLAADAYAGAAGAHGGRLFLPGQALPPAGAYGAVRAFDVPGLEQAQGWITALGSMRRDRKPQ